MKVLTLTIKDTRGIRNLSLQPNGKSLVISGPNGSGKSGVIDALDFLLTGKITRLTGEGTRGISLRGHGPHILSAPSDAVVSGTFSLETGHTLSLSRTIGDGSLKVKPESALSSDAIAKFRRGRHLLTRRDILHFISADAGTRGDRMKRLLDVADIDATRAALVATRNQLKNADQTAQNQFGSTRAKFSPLIGTVDVNPITVLTVANDARSALGAEPITGLLSNLNSFQDGVDAPGGLSQDKRPTRKQLDQSLEVIFHSVGSGAHSDLIVVFDRLLVLLGALVAEPALLSHYKRRDFLDKGLAQLGDDSDCPLCDTRHPPGELREHLIKVLGEIDETEKRVKELDELRNRLLVISRAMEAVLDLIVEALRAHLAADASDLLVALNDWQTDLYSLTETLEKGVETLGKGSLGSVRLSALVTDDRVEAAKAARDRLVAAAVTQTPEQQAWDLLTKMDQLLLLTRSAERTARSSRTALRRAEALVMFFDEAQASVLDSLYESIKRRFVHLYKSLHGSDEEGFEARLLPEGSSLDLEVGFYDQGLHPPQALHSEGHQDSMGLCLFLALSEKLAGGDPSPVLLDDVVMSVDVGHRRQFAALLGSEFPDVQFVFTTHDDAWAEQLVKARLVPRVNSHRFGNWDLAGGPRTSIFEDRWDSIAGDIENGNIDRAAGTLRRTAEEFFQNACDCLDARVRFSIVGQWELGDLLPPAVSRLNRLVTKAMSSAKARNDFARVAELTRFSDDLAAIMLRVNSDQWSVNANVHYNSWGTFHRNDFEPVVSAFRDLFAAFQCDDCGSLLRVLKDGRTDASLTCVCGRRAWSLAS